MSSSALSPPQPPDAHASLLRVPREVFSKYPGKPLFHPLHSEGVPYVRTSVRGLRKTGRPGFPARVRDPFPRARKGPRSHQLLRFTSRSFFARSGIAFSDQACASHGKSSREGPDNPHSLRHSTEASSHQRTWLESRRSPIKGLSLPFDTIYPGRFRSAARKSSTGLEFSTSSFVSQARRNCFTP